MTTKIRLSSAQVAQIARLTQEMLSQTPTGELQRGPDCYQKPIVVMRHQRS